MDILIFKKILLINIYSLCYNFTLTYRGSTFLMTSMRSLRAVLSAVLFATTPAVATGGYAITEVEPARATPLEIMNGRIKKRPLPKAVYLSKSTATRYSLKQQRRTPVTSSMQKILYLTFDDGPVTGTANVLRVLREEGIEATMFFVGKHIRKSRALYNRALSMPNLLIANHTYSHANGKYSRFYSDIGRLINDIDSAQHLIGGAKYLRLAGRNVWRLPHIYRNDHALSSHRRSIEIPKYEALASRGYQIYGWDIEWQFDHATGRPAYDAAVMASRIEQRYKRHATARQGKMILLTHDNMFRGASGIAQLRSLIRTLKYNGWRFATIDNYSSRTPSVLVRDGKSKPASSRRQPLKVLRSSTEKSQHTITVAWTHKKRLSRTQKILQVQ